MTREKLMKEATTTLEWELTPMIDRPTFIHGYITSAMPREKQIEILKEENKKIWIEACDKYGEANLKLTKAKEIIKKFSEFVNSEIEYDPEHPQEHTDLWNELCKEAEQFLQESE